MLFRSDLVAIVKEMGALYDKTRQYGSREVVIDGGTYGYGILTINKQLNPMIVDWMKTQIGGKTS